MPTQKKKLISSRRTKRTRFAFLGQLALRAQDKSPAAVCSYLNALQCFTEWLTQTRGESYATTAAFARAITPTDVREYRVYLLNVRRAAAGSINQHLVALREYLAKRPKVKHDAFFVNQRGEPLGRLGIEYQVATLGRLAGLEKVTPHMLRHTFAKNLVDQGVSLDQVAILLGHRSLTTTARYTQPSQQDLVRVVERLGEDE